jgi:hypothetical protein
MKKNICPTKQETVLAYRKISAINRIKGCHKISGAEFF